MKKILIAIVTIGIIGGLALLLRKDDNATTPISTPSSSNSNNTQNTPAPSSASTTYKDGSYTGDPQQINYGTVQIKAVISGGKITDIQFVQMPNDPGHTTEVTTAAEPVLKQEAITKQSASVDILSGATQTSEAFQQSLASALAMAK